jgi:hypothetical protein
MKTTSKGSDIKILILEYLCNHCSDFPQISNLSLGVRTKIKFDTKTTSNGRRPLMEDNLKILKVKYQANCLRLRLSVAHPSSLSNMTG